MLRPTCPRCGSVLRAVPADQLEQARREDADTAEPRRRGDGTAMLAVLLAGPWLLPLIGVHIGDFTFAPALIVLAFTSARTAARARTDAAWRPLWQALALSTGLAALASGLGILSATAGGGDGIVFYVGAGSSVLLTIASGMVAWRSRVGLRWERLVDAALLGLVVIALSAYLLVIPGLRFGDAALTGVVVLDGIALMTLALSGVARRANRRTPGIWWLAGGMLAAMAGDGLASAAAAGQIRALPSLTALAWAVAGFAVAVGAHHGIAEPRPEDEEAPGGWRWLLGRVALPLLAVLSFPVAAVALDLAHPLPAWSTAFFASFGVLALGLAFGRQAYLLLDHDRSMRRERRLLREATRRNRELEALTGLATTMTQTLEEEPIVEQALGVLQTAARATSAALHLDGRDGARLVACAGEWHREREWANRLPGGHAIDVRGGRAILRLPVEARGARLGCVTFLRPASEPFASEGVELLRLLVDQLGVAVQNARDYRQRAEQAVRDPLTGLHNRRFLLEALDKEVARVARYGGEATLVLFDLDDFKLVNERHGHAAGDDVLRALAARALGLVRPADTVARMGGEEFALLLPQTSQLEGLLVAERLRAAIARDPLLGARRITISAGIATCPSDAETGETLQGCADGALFWAKRNGKDICAVAGEATGQAADVEADNLVAHLYGLVAMIDARVKTRAHAENVAAYAVAIGQALGFERERSLRLRRAGMLHDVGKVAVDAAILAKPAALTDDEFAAIREHSVTGGMMLAHAGLPDEADWVRHHHERADGRGYPDGLTLDEIALEARILFVADSFEAMTSDRPYRDGMPAEDALAELRRCAGTQFDPAIVDVLERLVTSGELPLLALRNG